MKIIKLSAIASTNSYLKELSKSTLLEDATVLVTNQQTKGRGQVGAVWQSQDGLSLTCSVFKRFSTVKVVDAFAINLAIGLGIIDVLMASEIPKLTLKWPNDIMSDGKKIGGILIENTVKGDKITSSIIGLGLNVNETEFRGLPNASSMKLQSGVEYDLDTLLVSITEAIVTRLQQLEAVENPFQELQPLYEALLFKKNKVATFEESSGKKFSGIIKGVQQNGSLYIEDETENLRTFQLKEIKLLF